MHRVIGTAAGKTSAAMAAVLAISGCGGGGGGGGDEFRIALDNSSLELQSAQGAAPAAGTVTARANSDYSGDLFVSAIVQGPGLSPIISVSVVGRVGTIELTTETGLASGSYSGTVSLLACSDLACANPVGGTPLQLNYTVRVTGFSVPAIAVRQITPETTPEQLGASIAIDGTAPGGSTVAWVATDDAPWLSLVRDSGELGTAIQYQIDSTEFAKLDDGVEHTASISVVSNSPNVPTISFPVRVSKSLGSVRGLGPYVLTSGSTHALIVRGTGFSSVLNPAVRLSIPGVSPTSVVRTNDRALVVGLPPLTAGVYNVGVSNALSLPPVTKRLVVIDPRSYSYAVTRNSASLVGLAFDNEREQAFSAARADGLVVRFRRTGGTWVRDSAEVAALADVGLSHDGESLLASSANDIRLLDPVTLSDIRVIPSGVQQMGGEDGIATTNDGLAWFPAGQSRLEMLDVATGAVTIDPSARYSGGPWFSVSRNGERLVISQGGGSFSELLYLNASDGVIRQLRVALGGDFFANAHLSDNGNRALINQIDFRDENFERITFIFDGGTYSRVAGAVSPDGSRCYSLGYPNSDFDVPVPNQTGKPRVFVYDCTVSTGLPPLLGYFEFLDYPGCWALNSLACPSVRPMRAITADGKALLFAGNRNFVVVPIPDVLTPP